MNSAKMEQQMRKAMESLGIHDAKISWYWLPKHVCHVEIPDEHEHVRLIIDTTHFGYEVKLDNCMSFSAAHMDFGCTFADGLAFVLQQRIKRILQEVS